MLERRGDRTGLILHPKLLPQIVTKSKEDNSVLSREKYLVFSDIIKSTNNIEYLVVYQTKLSRILNFDELAQWKEIASFVLLTKDKTVLMFFDKKMQAAANSNDMISAKDSYTQRFEQEFAQVPLELGIEISGNARNTFMSFIPYLMLMFGAVLTVIGTMYVRNNHMQSVKLSLMNKVLAEKNQELNKQISERERLYQTLKSSEEEHLSVINSVSDIIFEAKQDGEIIFLNDSWHAITGLESTRMIGKSLLDMLHSKDRAETKKAFIRVLDGESKDERLFTKIKTLNGTFREVEMSLSVLKKDKNKESLVVGTIVDIEERRQAEMALAVAEKKYRDIVENSTAGIFQISPEGQFISANAAMAKILGYENAYDLMQEVTDFAEQLYVHDEDRNTLSKMLTRNKGFNNYEVQLRHKDGYDIWVSESARIVKDDEGHILYFEGLMEDISQRKKAEMALKDAKVESDLANRAKSEFLANMSHELRTPLNAIIGFSEIIKNEVFGPVGQKEYNEYASDIYSSGRKLLKVINEILDVSKIEAGERQLNESVVNLGNAVQSCVALVMPKAETSHLVIENLIDEATPQLIGEELAIKQMMLNLLSNAVKFTAESGHIIISHELDNEHNLRINVTDTGIGMSDDEIKKALMPFGQIDSAHARANSGTGLGLTLVTSLLKLHGGRLDIQSEKGKGTTVSMIFPAKRVATQRRTKEEREADALARAGHNVVKFTDKK
jgi:PAS domain S-box-containing protein